MFLKLCCKNQSVFLFDCLSLGFISKNCFNCHQCSVPQELTALGWTGSRASNICCLPAPRSLQGNSCCWFPQGWGEERSAQWALMETALLTRKVFLHFFPNFATVFLCRSRGWRDQWTSESAGHFFLLVHNSPHSLSPLTSALSAVVACSVWWLCPRTVLSHVW